MRNTHEYTILSSRVAATAQSSTPAGNNLRTFATRYSTRETSEVLCTRRRYNLTSTYSGIFAARKGTLGSPARTVGVGAMEMQHAVHHLLLLHLP
jgi:hypothetical protein